MKIKKRIVYLALMAAVFLSACSSKVRADAGLEGKYIPVLGEMWGLAMGSEDLEGFSVELQSGGKAKLEIDGDEHNVKWENDDTTVTLTVDGEKLPAEIGTDTLAFDDMLGMGIKITFISDCM